jgi:hypothetical protein
MTDYIVIAILVVVIGSAIAYIIREKKRGTKCIGCPSGANCGSCKNCSGNCACATEEEKIE